MTTEKQIELIDFLLTEAPAKVTLDKMFPTVLSKATIVIGIIFVLLAAILLITGIKNTFTDYILIILLVLIYGLYILDFFQSVFFQSAWAMRNPKRVLVETANTRLKKDNHTIYIIKEKYQKSDIHRCAEHLEQVSTDAKYRALALVGKLWELGLFPAIVTFFFTYYFQAQKILPEYFVPSVLIAIVGSYIMGLVFATASRKVEYMIYLLRRADTDVSATSLT